MGARTFSALRDEETYISFPIPTTRKPSTDIKVIVSFTNVTTQVGDKVCRWVFEYVSMDPADDYDLLTETSKANNKVLATNQSANVDTESELTLVYNDSDNPLSKKKVKGKLMRESTHASDTMTDDAAVDVVYLEYTEGT